MQDSDKLFQVTCNNQEYNTIVFMTQEDYYGKLRYRVYKHTEGTEPVRWFSSSDYTDAKTRFIKMVDSNTVLLKDI